MIDQLVLQGCSPDTKSEIRASWKSQRESLERLLRGTPPHHRHLRLTVRRLGQRYQARAVLVLPTGTLVATNEAYEALEALGDATARLRESVRRHLGALREQRLRGRKLRGVDELAAAGNALEEHGSTVPEQGFFEHLRPLLRSLRDHAHRELVIAQLQGDISPGDLTVSDLLGEVLVRAHDRMGDRPAGKSWNDFLIGLLHEILDERAAIIRPEQSMEARVPVGDPRYEADLGWISENEPFWGPSEPLTFEQVVAEEKAGSPASGLAEQEQREWILERLHRMPRDQRRAFSLFALEGWEIGEIASLQRRTPAGVRADIDYVRESLAREMAAHEGQGAESAPSA